MMEERIIPTWQRVPYLSEKVISKMSELCFRHADSVQPVDVLFVFGAWSWTDEQANFLNELLIEQHDCILISTGWIPKYSDSYDTWWVPESRLLAAKLHTSDYPNLKLLFEEKSTNTRDNVIMSLPLLDWSNIQTVWLVVKSFHAGRAFLTFQTFVPGKRYVQYSYAPHRKDGTCIYENSWHENPLHTQTVREEFLKIREYGRRWCIDISPVAWLVDDITNEINE
jgi:hypothetical protein